MIAWEFESLEAGRVSISSHVLLARTSLLANAGDLGHVVQQCAQRRRQPMNTDVC